MKKAVTSIVDITACLLVLPDQGFPISLIAHRDKLLTLDATKAVSQKPDDLLLPDQGSNLESSDPESDVLPIPPSGTVRRSLSEGGHRPTHSSASKQAAKL